MKVYLDMTRNHPDIIMERDGARIQDPRFALLHSISWPRFLLIKLIIWFYDNQKDWIRKMEDIEAGVNGLKLPRKERFWKKYWLKKGLKK